MTSHMTTLPRIPFPDNSAVIGNTNPLGLLLSSQPFLGGESTASKLAMSRIL